MFHHDRATVTDRSPQATYAPEQLGRTQAMTPEGYLLCSDVRVARTGSMLYLPREVPEVRPDTNGQMVVVLRDADVLFAPETLASFNGKPITNDHPPALLTPGDTKRYQIGVMLNPRQGEGVDADYMVADLLITDAETMAAVQARRKREVSLGYDCELEELKPGLGRQTQIIGNHIAIVDRGRAGTTCAIQDKEINMAKRKVSLMDRIRKAFRDNDETALEAALDDAPDIMGQAPDDDDDEPGEVHVHIHQDNVTRGGQHPVNEDENPYEGRMKALEDAMEGMHARFDEMAELMRPKEEPNGEVMDDAEEEEEAENSEMMDAASKAEIILPGYKSGTMDAKHAKRRAITDMRRDVLTRALADSSRRAPVAAVVAGLDLAKAKPMQIRAVFDAAAFAAKASNNTRQINQIPQGPMTPAKMQERILARRAGR